MRITEKIFCLPMVSYIKGLLDMDKSGRIMLYFLNPRRDVWLLLTLQLAYIRLFATRHYTGFHCCVMLVMWHNVTLSLSPLSVSECSVCGRGPEWRVEPTLREDAALKTGSGRAGPGWAFASNIGRQWANRERERERGRPWPGAHSGHWATICTVSRQIRANLNITTQEIVFHLMRNSTRMFVLTWPYCQAMPWSKTNLKLKTNIEKSPLK